MLSGKVCAAIEKKPLPGPVAAGYVLECNYLEHWKK